VEETYLTILKTEVYDLMIMMMMRRRMMVQKVALKLLKIAYVVV